MNTAAQLLSDLRPSSKTNVMVLLEAAGHDVNYWHRNADGSPVATPAANPNYCYDWSFGSATEGIVLCIWHDSIEVSDDRLILTSNMRALDADLSAIAGNGSRDPKDRDRARQQATRARAFDALVRTAFERLLPIRFILNEGNRRSAEELGAASSVVLKRTLDDASWYVHEYNERTGHSVLVRGVLPARDVVDVNSPDDDYRGPDDQRQLKAISVRRGQREFRDRLLAAWKRRCVITECRVEGLLEAAHIIPHSEITDYRASNGLLLRADIHTPCTISGFCRSTNLCACILHQFLLIQNIGDTMASELSGAQTPDRTPRR